MLPRKRVLTNNQIGEANMDARTDPSFGTTDPSAGTGGTTVPDPLTPVTTTNYEPESQSKTQQATAAAQEQAKEVAGTAAEAARGVAAEAGQQARQVAGEASRQARGLADQAREQARQQADSQTQRAADNLQTLSQQFRALAEGRQEQSGEARKYLEWFADRAGEMAQQLETRGLDGIVQDIKGFARRRPGLFLAGSAATGFLASRIAKSASSQTEEPDFSPASPAVPALSPSGFQDDTTRIGDLPVEPLPVPTAVDPTVVPSDVDPSVVETSETARSSAGADQDEPRGGM